MLEFDTSFVMAKEGIPFTKYGLLNELEPRHEADLCTSYNKQCFCKIFYTLYCGRSTESTQEIC